jgi:plastocyanin
MKIGPKRSSPPDAGHVLSCSRPNARLRAVAWLLAAAALQCGGPAQAQNPSFAISIQDNAFVPAELDVPAGQKIELHVTNKRASASEFESFPLRREKIVPPGEEVTVYVGPLRPGSYEFFDDFNPQTRGHLIAR